MPAAIPGTASHAAIVAVETAASIPGVFFGQARRRGDAVYQHFHRNGSWQSLSWAATAERVARIACALIEAGLRPGDHVALMSPNCPEWLWCDFAIMAAGGVTVPIYPSMTPNGAGYIASDSNTRLAIVSSAAMTHALEGRDYPERIFTLDGDLPAWIAKEPNAQTAAELGRRMAGLEPDRLATVIYTSGTSGEPKGVMFTHRHFIESAHAALQMFHIGPDDELLSYLPFSHVLERVDGIFVETMAGCTLWLARGLDTLVEDIQVARPTIMLGVPRVFEKVYEAVSDQVAAQPIHRRAIFRWALGIGAARLHHTPGPWLRLRLRVAERLVLRPLRARLTGGRLRFFISGGAPLNEKVEQFFWAIGVKILQGWGLTETTSGATSNTEELHRYRTVGVPLPGTRIRVADDGEILVHGPGVMAGYKNRPEATSDAISDGWLKTGDMGFVDSDGFLTITDRKKDLIKTSGGKYVAPLPIESQLESHRYVKSSLVVGDKRPYVVALIVPDWQAIAADDHHPATGPPVGLPTDPGLRDRFARIVNSVNQSLASFESIKCFVLLPRDFSEAEGELTPSLKKKRQVISRHFAPEIEALYGQGRRRPAS